MKSAVMLCYVMSFLDYFIYTYMWKISKSGENVCHILFILKETSKDKNNLLRWFISFKRDHVQDRWMSDKCRKDG